jgi:NADH-quinone oxidoreductase subunit E
MLNTERLNRIEGLRQQFPKNQARSLILPVLHMIQEEHGHVPENAIPYVADLLSLPEIWVHEAVTWYSMLHIRTLGKYHIQVCHNLSCALRGAEDILEYLQQKLGIQVGETTPDGKFSLATVECLASCGSAPVMQVNETYHENLTMEKVDQILAELK